MQLKGLKFTMLLLANVNFHRYQFIVLVVNEWIRTRVDQTPSGSETRDALEKKCP